MAFQPNDDAIWISLLRQQMDEMFNYIREQGCGRYEFSPNIDIYESSAHFVIEVDLPGLSESDFTVMNVGSTIRIEGLKHQEKSGSPLSYICLERHFGRFSRTVEIPALFDPGRMQTAFELGALTIKLPLR